MSKAFDIALIALTVAVIAFAASAFVFVATIVF